MSCRTSVLKAKYRKSFSRRREAVTAAGPAWQQSSLCRRATQFSTGTMRPTEKQELGMYKEHTQSNSTHNFELLFKRNFRRAVFGGAECCTHNKKPVIQRSKGSFLYFKSNEEFHFVFKIQCKF